MEAFEIHLVQLLVLVETGKNDLLLAAFGIFVALQALGADFLHHALHGRVNAADGHVFGLEESPKNAIAGLAHRIHHHVRADDDNTIDLAQGDIGLTQATVAIGLDGFDDIGDHCLVLRAGGLESGFLVTAPDDGVAGLENVFHVIAVHHLLVATEIEHTGTGLAQGLADGKQHRIAEAAAHQHHRLIFRRFRGRARGTHQDHRLARLEMDTQIR